MIEDPAHMDHFVLVTIEDESAETGESIEKLGVMVTRYVLARALLQNEYNKCDFLQDT